MKPYHFFDCCPSFCSTRVRRNSWRY